MSSSNTISNKRLAKNTLLLYVRMLLTMGIGLFAVRVVLQALGETDYGIYNVVGGIITMLAFLNNTLASTTQRFLSFELGSQDSHYNEVFSTSLSLYALLALVLVVFGETVGLWFVNSELTIPEERMFAANCVYQCSIVSFVFTVLCAPYNAAIIAHERMSFFAYVSIVDAICKLGICYFLLNASGDKLILYGILMMLMSIAVFIAYVVYCRTKHFGCRFRWFLNREYVSKIASFAGWGTFGAFANIFRAQGINFLLNIFFGPIVNAARGIAYQAEAALLTFVQNFYIAVRPQTIKAYAEGQKQESVQLALFASKIGFAMMLLLSLIFVAEADYIFHLWLGEVNDIAIIYFKIIMLSVLIETLTTPLNMLIHANGNVRNYQLTSGLITASTLLLAGVFLFVSHDNILPMVAVPIMSVFLLLNIVYQVKRLMEFPLKEYSYILFKIVIITIVAWMLVYSSQQLLPEGFYRLMLTIGISSILSICGLFILLSTDEREKTTSSLKQLAKKFKLV